MEYPQIHGAEELSNWFGYWPDFHDAEIIGLQLNTTGSSPLTIRTWESSKELDERGYFKRSKEVIVQFLMSGILSLELDDFSHQNVIGSLGIEQTEGGFRIVLSPCYGLSGTIEASNITISLTPVSDGLAGRSKPTESI